MQNLSMLAVCRYQHRIRTYLIERTLLYVSVIQWRIFRPEPKHNMAITATLSFYRWLTVSKKEVTQLQL